MVVQEYMIQLCSIILKILINDKFYSTIITKILLDERNYENIQA